MRGHVFALALALLFAPSVRAVEPDPAGYERILLPVIAQGRGGAFESVWRTELTIRNEGSVPAQIFQEACVYFCTCLVVFCSSSETAPGTAKQLTVTSASNPANVGAFVYANKNVANELALQLRVRDVSRSRDSWGTEVPVVRDRDMRHGTTHLLDVPVREGFRQHLRLYAASSVSGGGDVLVRIFVGSTNELLDERILVLQPGTTELGRVPAQLPADDELPAVPAYAELTSFNHFNFGAHGTVRFEIVPLSAGLRYWAMMSVTNNATQHVTLITPQ